MRDRQVRRARFTASVTENDLLAEQLRYRSEVMAHLDTERYRALLADLARWRTAPPLTETAASGARVLKKFTRKAHRTADKRLAAALDTGDDEALHRAREAAKRARYAGELTRGLVAKKKGKKRVAEYKKVQRVLGEHQDSVVALGRCSPRPRPCRPALHSRDARSFRVLVRSRECPVRHQAQP